MIIKYNAIEKVIIFGGSQLAVATSKYLRNSDLDVVVYTSPRHAEESVDIAGNSLAKALSMLDVNYYITKDINTDERLKNSVTKNTLGLGMGEAWSFSSDIIALFDGHLLDFMGIPHPRYRGGAHYTWMILRGDRSGACNLQVINTDMVQGEFDSGDIVKTKEYLFPESAKTPQDYFDFAINKEVNFIREFIEEVKLGKEFAAKQIDESKSLFLPRLNTLQQGWIDWSCSGRDLYRFICAFDNPYIGASTFLNSFRVHLLGACLDVSEKEFHPYQSGLVTRINQDSSIIIATTSGHLKVSCVKNERGEVINNLIKPGQRFHTPMKNIEYSKCFMPSYTAISEEECCE